MSDSAKALSRVIERINFYDCDSLRNDYSARLRELNTIARSLGSVLIGEGC